MGGGILPVAKYKGKLYFLFGKEEEDKKWGDFGGGAEKGETQFQTAIREGYEELDGILGSKYQLKKLVDSNFITEIEDKSYRTFLFKINYDNNLPLYFKNHHDFIKTHMPGLVRKNNGLFEKSEIKWWSLHEIKQQKYKFRKFYRVMIDELLKNSQEIAKNI
jgi:hypothetical protein